MSSRPRATSSAAETLPECDPPSTRLGAPITMLMPAGAGGLGRRHRGRELGDRGSRRRRLPRHARASCRRGSRGPRHGPPMQPQHGIALSLRMLALLPQPALDDQVDFRVAPAGMQGAEPGDVAILPLAGRVVHERDQAQGRLAHQRLEQLEHVRVGDLQAQMQEMVGLERPAPPGPGAARRSTG